jgi:protein ImuB
MKRRILCLRFPAWPLQRLVAGKRELRETRQAIVIHYRDPRRGERVKVCSSAAWKQGVRPGMPLTEAVALFPDEKSVHVSAHNPTLDRRWLARIAAWCERFSPLVGWDSQLPEPDALYLDITGIGVLFGGEESLAKELRTGIAQRQLSVRLGVADTIGAAWAVACATSSATLVPTDRLEAALAPLPIAVLRLNESTLTTLGHLGITIVSELLALPRAALSSRFGPELLQRIDQALGNTEELIQPHRPAPPLQTEWIFEIPTDHFETVECVLRQLVDRLASELAQRQQGAAGLECRLDCAGHEPLRLGVGLYRPTASARHLWDLLRMQLERLRIPAAVGRLEMSVVRAVPLVVEQACLFDDLSLQHVREAAALLDRLSSRLGDEAVLQPRLRADALPERAVVLLPAVSLTHKKAPPGPSRFAVSHRPLTLFSPPVPLEVTAVSPDGPPVRFFHDHQELRVLRHWGPERIQTGWWRGKCVQRDYYRVETTVGARYWLFRQLQDGQWFLHGVFE